MKHPSTRRSVPKWRLTLLLLVISSSSTFPFVQLSSSPRYGQDAIDIDESCPRDMSSLEEWSVNCGIQKAPGVELTTFDGLDFQIMTTQDQAANTPVLFVPAYSILSSQLVHKEVGDGRGEIDGRQMNARTLLNQLGQTDHFPRFCLFLKILMEYEKGLDSPWFPWLNSLPRYCTNGASMTEFCFTCLPPLAAKLAGEERKRCSVFRQTLAQTYGNLVSDSSKQNEQLMRWAYSAVYTRCRARKGEPVLVPMADFFNHATYPNSVLQYDDEGNCYVTTTADVPAGSPLTISYTNGDNTNPSFLLARYGFLDHEAPATFCKYMIEKPSQEIVGLGYHPSKMLFHNTGEISEAVWDITLYQLLDGMDEQQHAFYEAHKQGDTNTKQAYHHHYFPQTSAALLEHVNGFLQQLENASNNAVGADLHQHPRIPNILSHNEFVRNTFIAARTTIMEQQNNYVA